MEALSGVKSSQQLAGLLSAYLPLLARDGNPYDILRTTIRDVVLAPQSAVARPVYILGSVVAAVDVLLFVAVWFIRWRKNSFWLVRKATSQGEVYYLAHSSLPYSFSIVLLCLGLQGFAWCMYKTAGRVPIPMTIYWVSLCWIPGLLGAILNCYTMGTAYILHLRSYTDKQAPRFSSPLILLGSALATAVAFLASSLPSAVRASKAYNDTMLEWIALDKLLAEAASLYTSGTASTFSNTANSMAPRLFSLVQQKERLWPLLRFAYLMYAAWAFLFGGIFCVVGVAYVRAVKRSLNEFKDRSPTASAVFSQTVRNLVALLLGYLFFHISVSINSIWVGILSEQVLNSGRVMQLSASVPLLAAVFGILAIALTMFYQALTAPTVYVPPSLSRTSTFLRSRSQSHVPKGGDLAAHYTRFALAASEFLPDQANLTLAGDLREGGRAGPFEDLELQPANDAESIKSVDVGERHNRGTALEGIAVHRQAVTVVSLPREGLDEVMDEKY